MRLPHLSGAMTQCQSLRRIGIVTVQGGKINPPDAGNLNRLLSKFPGVSHQNIDCSRAPVIWPSGAECKDHAFKLAGTEPDRDVFLQNADVVLGVETATVNHQQTSFPVDPSFLFLN